MKAITHIVSVALVASCTVLATASTMADTSSPAPAASIYYPLVGKWTGQGQMSEPGQQPVSLKLNLVCNKASSGWAVRCDMSAENDNMQISESDLMGVDPVTGKGHWYSVTNMGESHDHLTEWPDASTMKAHYTWTQDGKQMQEKIMFNLKGKKSMEFTSIVSAEGQEVGKFSGTLMR